MEQSDRDQSETDQPIDESFTPQAARSAVGRWSVDRYVSLIRPWVIVAGLIAILLVLFQANRVLVTLIQVAACVWVGSLVQRRRGQRIEALTAGAMTGLALGLMTGLARFALEPTGYWLINILFETILFGLVGAILSLGALAARTLQTNSYHK